MNQLYAGFGRANITPMLGIGMAGYFKPRFADGVLDELEVNALALSCGEQKTVLISIDHCGVATAILDEWRRRIAELAGVPGACIFIHATHTHTGPYIEMNSADPLVEEYRLFVSHKVVDSARLALDDLRPAKMGWAVSQAPNIAFVRRYRMKDGSVRTNPGVNNPDILAPIGEVDERVNVLRFDREGAESIVLVNFGDHPDTVGGCKISADWPGFSRRAVEKALDDTKCIFFNGAQGDINHVNVRPKGGDLNDMFMDFDDVSRGYGHARHMGRVVAGAVLQVFDKVAYEDVDAIRCAQKTIHVPSNMPRPEEMKQAYEINALHKAGRDEEIPFKGMMLTTVVAEAERMVRLEHGPESFPMLLSAVAIGNLALVGLPGEPFTGIGRALKEAEGWSLVLPCCNVNAKEGYFPMKDAYDEGGYEARSSKFKAGVAELLIDEGKQLLNELR